MKFMRVTSIGGLVWLLCVGLFLGLKPVPAQAFFYADQPQNSASAGSSKVGDGYWLTPEKTLRRNLKAWSQRAGWVLVWNIDSDLPVPSKMDMGPDYIKAFSRTIHAYHNTVHIQAIFHKRSRTVVVSSP